jgi:hypothetical protein
MLLEEKPHVSPPECGSNPPPDADDTGGEVTVTVVVVLIIFGVITINPLYTKG